MSLWKSEKGLEVTANSFISVKYSKNTPYPLIDEYFGLASDPNSNS
jgi:hypothetical protein